MNICAMCKKVKTSREDGLCSPCRMGSVASESIPRTEAGLRDTVGFCHECEGYVDDGDDRNEDHMRAEIERAERRTAEATNERRSTDMRLKDLIEELKGEPADNYLRIDGSPVGLSPQGVGSYRGYYEDLTIHVETERYGGKVGDFVSLLESRIGSKMTGYKGGDYTISPHTKVWISNDGEASGARVTGVRREEWGTYITWENDDE